MKKKILLIVAVATIAIGSIQSSAAQSHRGASRYPYQTSLGLNVGAVMGINFKQFVGNNSALEFDLGYQIPHNGVMFSAVYQYHINLVDNLYLYVGGGFNIGGQHFARHADGEFVFGIDPNIGFEYKFDGAPIALALDYKPQINIASHSNWNIAGFKIRFTL